MSYKVYQQVLNFSVKPKAAQSKTKKTAKSSVNKKDVTTPIKRRTKTGCLTCRKRKKKCDEDKVDGKCQACTRNFLECYWPEPSATLKSPSPDCCSSKGMSAYPSPVSSPITNFKQEVNDVKLISLPPLRDPKYKIGKSTTVKKEPALNIPSNKAKYIITSITRDRALCQISTN